MTGLAVILFLVGLLGAAVSLVLIVIRAVKKQPKKKAGLALAVCFALFVISIIIMPKQTETPTQTEALTQTETNEEQSQQQVIYYEKNDRINQYITAFNERNQDYQLTSDDLFVYHHHGKDHDEQVKIYRDGFEIVLSDVGTFQVFIGENGEQKTMEEFKNLFIRFALPYSPNLNEEILDGYWQQVLDDLTNNVRFEEFEVDINMYHDDIGYLTIRGKLA